VQFYFTSPCLFVGLFACYVITHGTFLEGASDKEELDFDVVWICCSCTSIHPFVFTACYIYSTVAVSVLQ